MFFGIKNGRIPMGDTVMEYIRFGTGSKTLIMLPGLGDGLRTIYGTALPFALMYYRFAKGYTVYSFSRKSNMEPGTTTRDMARDIRDAMDYLDIEKADVFGVSMGGMLSQHLAIDYPERVGKLVLVVTASRTNSILEESVHEWMDLARKDDHTALMDSNLRRIYTPAYYGRNRWTIPLIGKLTKPKSYERFLTMAQACLDHDAYEGLSRIQSPTLVVGGGKDQSLGGEASREIARQIPDSRLVIFEEQGHGLYEEEKTFNDLVLDFLRGTKKE